MYADEHCTAEPNGKELVKPETAARGTPAIKRRVSRKKVDALAGDEHSTRVRISILTSDLQGEEERVKM
ncbi:hypothetical protein PHSY_002757 [Pseudozyma hubeiensis SY62]|uniref:Uncharacterized protein n=1 Tax=Pseudozyma hubeiensis (strain SY62) TaxID=1305764 RepID=R9P1X7_PSEHS|nr:hypothetical protein PHSY_002757 [Pseudozyma hubeiensis SY62]GAC95182.1 hypothetical protein PHSY_002757 [Pseudozyma hubeiensis SY62]